MLTVNTKLDRQDLAKAIIELQPAAGISPVNTQIDDQDLAAKIKALQVAFDTSVANTQIDDQDLEAKIIEIQNIVAGGGTGTGGDPGPTGPLPLHTRIAFEGDSITRGSNGPAFIQFAIYFTRGRYLCPYGYNQGFGGDTIGHMALPAQTSLVTAVRPKVVVLLAGTNDLAGTADTPATIFANIRTCIAAYQAAGAQVINCTVMPRGLDEALNTAREADRLTLNNLIRAQTDVKVVDLEFFDPVTMSMDNGGGDHGLHPNYLGAMMIGQHLADVLNTLIVTDDPVKHSFDATNLMLATDNPQFVGTAGTTADGVTGVIPTGWVLDQTAGSGLTVVGAPATLNGNNALQITVSGTSAIATVVTFRNIINFTGDVAGDVYESWWDFEVANTKSLALLSVASGATTNLPISNVNANTNYPDGSTFAGVARTAANSPNPSSNTNQPAQTVSNGALASIGASFQISFPAGVVCGGTYTIAAPSMSRLLPGAQ